MSFYNMQAPVIVFTEPPRLVLATMTETSLPTEIVSLFGKEAKLVRLQDVWDDFWVEKTQTVIDPDGVNDWIIVALQLYSDDAPQKVVSDELIEEFSNIVRQLRGPQVNLDDVICGQGKPKEFLELDNELSLKGLAEKRPSAQ